MKYLIFLFSFLILSNQAKADDTYYKNLQNSFSQMAFDESEVYDVSEIYLNFDKASIVLNEGQIYFTKPINGMTISAIFIGKAEFDYQPNDYRSKFYLTRSYNSIEVHKEIKELFFFFSDSLGLKLKSELAKSKANITEYKKELLKKFNNLLFADSQRDIPMFWLFKPILDKKYNNNSLVIFNDVDNKTYGFSVNHFRALEIQFSSIEWSTGIGHYFHVDCFHHAEGQDYSIDTLERKDKIKVLTNKTSLSQRTKSRADALVEYTGIILEDDPRWLDFDIDPSATFKSIKFNNSKELDWFKKRENSQLFIGFPDGLKKGDTFKLLFEYEGNMMERSGEYAYVNYWNLWCPRYSYDTEINYDVTLTFPMHFNAICTDPNAIIKESVNDGERTVNFKTTKPHESFYFNYAIYKNKEIKFDHGLIRMYYITVGQADEILELVKAIANTCYQKIGPIPYDTINLVEEGGTFYSNNYIIFPTSRISNYSYAEVQDFRISNNLVDFWITNNIKGKMSKSDPILDNLAFYLSSLFFMQNSKNVKDALPNFLRESKNELIKYRKGNGSNLDCYIPLGFQSGTNNGLGYWIFRMLHFIMTDDKTRNDADFFALIKDFYNTYQGKKVSYIEFINFFQSKTKEDISWFFNQWVFDSYIPSYKYAYKINKKSDNEFVVSLKVKQSNVPQNFQMIMPITIVFNNGQQYRLRALVNGEKGTNKDYCEFDLPILPFEIDKVIIDDSDMILAEKEDVDWEDI